MFFWLLEIRVVEKCPSGGWKSALLKIPVPLVSTTTHIPHTKFYEIGHCVRIQHVREAKITFLFDEQPPYPSIHTVSVTTKISVVLPAKLMAHKKGPGALSYIHVLSSSSWTLQIQLNTDIFNRESMTPYHRYSFLPFFAH